MSHAVLTPVERSRALLHWHGGNCPAMLGAAGLRGDKSEGDHATPAALLPLRRIFYRADRVARPRTTLPCEPLSRADGWCDDPGHPDYNRFITLPHPGRHETLWRDDHAYDLIAVLGWNDDPPRPGRGSAIFLHLPTASGVTEGCIAVEPPHWRALIEAGVTAIDARAF
ncbi:L,D-transpeptidase family protein [Acidomonas methanolica]|nr:L,D-transpeptidase family protein [Acidomonas methanolica]TCS32356.1 L,D-peptidoglycan transpeptidase YkuD (ErfK/YbiS/YcfS/YnhG family) [Acidomonas methanolica]